MGLDDIGGNVQGREEEDDLDYMERINKMIETMDREYSEHKEWKTGSLYTPSAGTTGTIERLKEEYEMHLRRKVMEDMDIWTTDNIPKKPKSRQKHLDDELFEI